MPIGTTSASLKDIMGAASESPPMLERILNRFSVYKGEPIIYRTARDRDICCIERLADINVIIAVSIVNFLILSFN